MANLPILYWRDIPAQVVVKAGRTSAKRELSPRFQEAIDMAAMKSGTAATDEYLAEWRRGEPSPCGDDLENEASKAAERLWKPIIQRSVWSPSPKRVAKPPEPV